MEKSGAGPRIGRAGGRRARLVITNGCFSGLEIVLSKSRTTLGRALSCDVCLDHSYVSSEHAIISRKGGEYVLEDLNSAHGTNVNGREVHRRVLRKNDTITIGMTDLRFKMN